MGLRSVLRRPAAALVGALMLAGCAEAELAAHLATVNAPEDRGRYHVGAPYERGTSRAVPREDFRYDETGLASWYGPGLHGRRTANGEIFDQNALTAAHPTLQLPAVALVTNLENGRSVRVRINDRGPRDPDRLIDVSRRAAQLLGFERQGIARVRVRVLAEDSLALRQALTGRAGPVEVAAAGAAAASPVWLDAGAFSDRSGAEAGRDRADTIGPARLLPVRVDGTDYWRLRLGPFDDRASAEAALGRAWRAGFADARLVAD
jgi:rare lipoprotein A